MSEKIMVEIFGQQLNLKSSANPQYAEDLASFVDEQIRKVANQSNDPLKVALLASMNIANELFEERRVQQESVDEIAQRADSLIEMLEKSA
ncbi:MAG: cell division protein ZapA [Nitrospinaceae bacterium]|jgi:cell division protein ZapA|nr:cell division protein ZapA [Nitrospinaceae bacterium]MBT3433302.1 cell division protein ZapA [Nitrospinaceae bacterium]MBT3821848.1 cell division protein ZapA [Nitrospinaceae bacterium]MBT4092925.1 cell division protein ZapA [Nitrospinaceae bacterium]MBT4429584.1 cell division protein ZapA [Nitrospinaceae bacterium]